ncbi:coadhesin-like [Oscarella lobularis]|uniref:coadhesin-like n=1 Tax=Oscarella lobularis TaxID=121494 RepID=UPI003313E38C
MTQSLLLVVLVVLAAGLSQVASNDVYSYIYRECRGRWTQWTKWETCTKTCGGGKQTRHRTCRPIDANLCWGYMKPTCKGVSSRSRNCNKKNCPVISGSTTTSGVYKWSAWASWSSCSVSCGSGGVKQRKRSCALDPKALYGPRYCQGKEIQKLACGTGCCPVDNAWRTWSAWSSCSSTCGNGYKRRTRHCDGVPRCGGKNRCVGQTTQKVVCNVACCPVDAVWKDWASWSACSVSCGRGTRYRTRACLPSRCNGKNLCVGPPKETTSCGTACCPVDGKWLSWSSWSKCSRTCGDGSKTKTRVCRKAQCGGRNGCTGAAKVTVTCQASSCCPVDGHWSKWSAWSKCSASCGGGAQSRSRYCTQEKCGGRRLCKGNASEKRQCNKNCCPVRGYITSWTLWASCTKTCGLGSRTRSRNCSAPLCHGRDPCRNVLRTQLTSCNLGCCPVKPHWSTWGAWSSCSATCNGGKRARTRRCVQPSNQHGCPRGSITCLGQSRQESVCNSFCCPENGRWESWGEWSKCSATKCGASGTKRRTRECVPPRCGGKDQCFGLASVEAACNIICCQGVWESWSAWSSCSVTCSVGVEKRTRRCVSNHKDCPANASCSGDAQMQRPCLRDRCVFLETAPQHATVCSPPPTVSNGFFVPSKSSYAVNERVAYGCLIGYRRSGKLRLTCTKKGTWRHSPPECEKKL